jgi:hypothetical protein
MGKASRGKWERRLQRAMQNKALAHTPFGRFLSYAENNLSLAGITLAGGIGAIVYGPILCFCVLLLLLGLHRSGTVNDLSCRVKALCYLFVFVASGTCLYGLGHIIESHKERPLTVAEIWAGHPPTAASTIYNTYPTNVIKAPAAGPQIDVGEPYLSLNDGQKYFTVDEINIGDEIARNAVNTVGVYVRTLGIDAEESIFRELYEKDIIVTKEDAVADQGMGLAHKSRLNFPAHFTTDDLVKLRDKKSGAYVVALITYSDSRGIRRATESCWIYSPLFPALGTCNHHNSIKVALKAKR